MINPLSLLVVVLAGMSVGIADGLIKKSIVPGSFWLTLKNPWMILVVALYLAQIVLFVYMFTHNWKLGVAGNLQVIFYSLTVVAMGYFIFNEAFSTIQIIGVVMAVAAIFLINQ